MIIRKYAERDLPEIIRIWNEVVEEGIAFPQEELLNLKSGAEFFAAQSYTAVAEEDGKIYGLYILHHFSLIGILSKLSGILAEHKIGIFAVSTYNTDYILVKEENFERALSVLNSEGYLVV